MAEPVVDTINKRFYNFLVSLQYALSQEDLDDGFVDVDGDDDKKQDDKQTKSRGRQERILLEVEKKRREDEERKQKAWKSVVDRATVFLNQHLKVHILENLQDGEYIAHDLLRLPENLTDLFYLSVSPASTVSKIAPSIAVHTSLQDTMLRLANNDKFRNMLGRPATTRVTDIRTALGLVGLDLLAVLLPITLIKRSVKFSNDMFPMMGEKLWSHTLTCGLSTEWLLRHREYKRPVYGLFAGLFSQLGNVALYDQYVRSFEIVKRRVLEDARSKGQRTLHDALFEVQPDPALFTTLVLESGKAITARIADAYEWKDFPQIKSALDQFTSDTPLGQCDEICVAMSQADYYSRFELLKRAKLFSKPQVQPFFNQVNLDDKTLISLLRACPRRLDIQGRG